MLMSHAFRPEFLDQFDIKRPVRIPKSFSASLDKPYHIPCIEMPAELGQTLDYESKSIARPRISTTLSLRASVAHGHSCVNGRERSLLNCSWRSVAEPMHIGNPST